MSAPLNEGDVDELRMAAIVISEALTPQLPADAALPRGYAIAQNRVGDLSLAREGKLLAPSFAEPGADRAAIEAFACDVKTGWLREIEEFIAGSER